MKTKLIFNESAEKRTVTLTHDKDVRISTETWEDEDYIVIRFPTNKVNMEQFELRRNDALGVGFKQQRVNDTTELYFYHRYTFTWNLYNLEKIGLWKAMQRYIPNEEEHYAYYANARGLYQWSYNLFFTSLQQLRVNRRKKKHSHKKELG